MNRASHSLKELEPEHLVQLLQSYKEVLGQHRQFVDSLNVYPVPDGDTGTNMFLTMEAVTQELEKTPTSSFQEICNPAARGAIMGARGNSGVILSQILKGFFETFATFEKTLDAKACFEGSQLATTYAYQAVSEPVEGTILTVIKEITEGGKEALDGGADLSTLVKSFQEAGAESLKKTPELLAVLRKAGVVDAGGAGLLLFFDALAYVVDGTELKPSPEVTTAANTNVDSSVQSDASAGASPAGTPSGELGTTGKTKENLGPRYEVMYLLYSEEQAVADFRKTWESLGDSIVISGVDDIWNCHIHTDEIGLAVEAGIAAGTPKDIRVTDLYEQIGHNDQYLTEPRIEQSNELSVLETHLDDPQTQVVVTGQGKGLGQLFASLGARVMVIGGQTQNPSTQTLVDALNLLEAPEALILPNNSNILAATKMAAEQVEIPIQVVETKSIVEGLSVLVAYDPMASAKSNAEQMEEVRGNIVSGEVTRAVRDSKELEIKEGDYIGLGSKEVLSVTDNLVSATCDLFQKLITPDHELLTLIEGANVEESQSQEILDWLKQNSPKVEVEFFRGGQDLYFYYIGIE